MALAFVLCGISDSPAAVEPTPASDATSQRVRWAAPPVPLPDFKLIDTDTRDFGVDALHGRTTLLYFGFTHCRDVCPATLQVLRQVIRSPELQSKPLAVVFVSVDGSRDTPAVVREYLKPFMPGFIGLTGEPADVRVLADEMQAVFFKGMPTDNEGGYDVEHTSQVYLVDARGSLRATIYGTDARAIAEATRAVVGAEE